MRLDEFIEGLDRDEAALKRQLVEEKSYEVTEYLADAERSFAEAVDGDSIFGSTAPSVFVGRSNYPRVSAGVLAPVADAEHAADYETGPHWYRRGFTIDDVFQARTNLLNSSQPADVRSAADAWDGFLGVQREVAIADRPVDVEVGLDGPLEVDLDVGFDDVATPTGPRARASSAELAENPSVPRAVEYTLSDDDWRAEGAINYLYNRGLDVYDINSVLSAGALGKRESRRLVPTRWSITAVDDTVGQFLRGSIRNAPSVDAVEVYYNEYLGNRFWVVLAPGTWEFELVEMKAPGSIWNPFPERGYALSAASEGREGRSGYVEETAGAYYAARLGALEHLADRDRQAKVLVLRHVTEDYWGPAGVWQVRETTRGAFEEGRPATAETFHDAVGQLADRLPVSVPQLRRKSEMVAGLQSRLDDWG
jgi:hypothetical protein